MDEWLLSFAGRRSGGTDGRQSPVAESPATPDDPGPLIQTNVQLCNHAHLSKFGGRASPERDLVFDINDSGPFECDVKRLGAALNVAGRQLAEGGPPKQVQRRSDGTMGPDLD